MKAPISRVGEAFKKIVESERSLLYCALAVGFILAIIQACFSVDLFRDSANVYAPMVRALANGNYKMAFHPGIPLLNVILSAPFSGLGVPPEKALSLVSGLFYVATIFFVYLLLSVFLPRRLASFGSLCFACAPKIIRFSCSALIDSGKIFFITAALFFLVRIILEKYKSWKHAALFGLMLGGMSLARSEGVGNAVVLFGCLGLYYLVDSLRERTLQPIRSVLVPIPIWSVCILLRALTNWRFCGVFAFDARISSGLSQLFGAGSSASANAATATAAGVPRVSYADLFNQYVRGSYELYLFLSIVGLLLVLVNAADFSRKLWPDKEKPVFLQWNRLYWIFFLVPISNALIFKASDIAAYRYFLLNIPCMMLFTVIAALWIWKWSIRFLPAVIPATAALVILFCQTQNGASRFFSADAKRHYETGKRVGALLEAEKNTAKVWFFRACPEWYFSETIRAVPFETAQPDAQSFKDFDYVLWSEEQDDFEILKARADLREIPLAEAGSVHLYKRIDLE